MSDSKAKTAFQIYCEYEQTRDAYMNPEERKKLMNQKFVSLAEYKRLEGVLLDIRKHYEKFPKNFDGNILTEDGSQVLFYDGEVIDKWLGVLLEEAKNK